MINLRKAAMQALCLIAILSATYGRNCAAGEGEVLLFDYESAEQKFENPGKLQYVAEHATQGAKAGKAVLEQPVDLNIPLWGGSNRSSEWGAYDQFVIDVFVENGGAVAVGFIKDKEAKDWWTRHNYELKLQPGKRRISFSLGALTRQNNKGTLDLKALDFFAMRLQSEDPKKPATVYLDNARLVKGTGSFEVKVLYSFDGGDSGKYAIEDYPENSPEKSSGTEVEEHASNGKKALKLDSKSDAGNIRFSGFDPDWSKYDSLAIDIFNPGAKPAVIAGWVRATNPAADWWNRHNYERVAKPVFNTLKFALGSMNTPAATGKTINLAEVVGFNIAVNHHAIFIDNIRLIKGVEEVPVAGLKKFDFGPATSGVMPGFQNVCSADAYSKEKGFGWMPGGQFGRDFDINEIMGRHRAPDDLCRDFLQPVRATFSVDVPDGTYGVWLMLGPPGNGWRPTFDHRSVSVNGKTVLDQQYNLDTFKQFEYQFQDFEDLPGSDIWERYINVLFKPVQFEAEAVGGQLHFDFNGYGSPWCCMLNGLVLWPKSSEADATRWLANLSDTRKEQFYALHAEKSLDPLPGYAANDQDKARGYVRFVHAPETTVNVNSVPTQAQVEAQKIALTAAPGECVDGCFGMQPLKDCGVLKLSVSDLKGPGGSIPASAVRLMVARYKAMNQTAVYTILPKYLDDVPAEGIAIGGSVTRSFWAITHVPENTAAGEYSGQIQLAFANGKTDTQPITITVYPIKLLEPEFPMGMFMMQPMQAYLAFDKSGEEFWNAWKEILADARDHGLTSVDPGIAITFKKIENGKAEFDFSRMDRWMEMARAAGFHQELNGYSINPGIPTRVQPLANSEAAAKKMGASSYAELIKLWHAAITEHAKEKNWLPICFCTDDEYIVHPGGSRSVLAQHHKVLQDNAPGFHFVAFDSAYYTKEEKELDEADRMLAEIDTWGGGQHSVRQYEAIKKGGRRQWLYNTGMNRFTFGAYMAFARYKYDVKGFFQWVYSGGGTYNNYYLASHVESGYGVVYPSSHGLRPTPVWERIRAGCNDHRYFETAFQAIQKSKADNKATAEAKELEGVIDSLFSKLTFGNRITDPKQGELNPDNPSTPEQMEAFKRKLAEGIVKLQNALK